MASYVDANWSRDSQIVEFSVTASEHFSWPQRRLVTREMQTEKLNQKCVVEPSPKEDGERKAARGADVYSGG